MGMTDRNGLIAKVLVGILMVMLLFSYMHKTQQLANCPAHLLDHSDVLSPDT